MDASIIFKKTERGESELSSPTLDLTPEDRQVLILIQGSRTVGDIALLMAGQADVRPILRRLLTEHLISTTSSHALTAAPPAPPQFSQPAAPQPPPAPTPAPEQAPVATAMAPAPEAAASPANPGALNEAKQAISRDVEQIFGPDADPIIGKIQAVESIAALSILATKIGEIARSYTSADQAQLFLARVRNRLERLG